MPRPDDSYWTYCILRQYPEMSVEQMVAKGMIKSFDDAEAAQQKWADKVARTITE